MTDPNETNEDINEELSLDELKSVSGGLNLPQGQSGNPTFPNLNSFDFGGNNNVSQDNESHGSSTTEGRFNHTFRDIPDGGLITG
ncbi:CCRG-2 family RiPP [Prochlorococcus sp. MIT 1201]|uniref:CCRG-2 family RiPP n=1 Tax=Prochlorococcus sp. MIT 1201 TaxID=3082535 RepID=UPI0039A4B587